MVASMRFKGSNCLRQRIILSLLTGKTLIIDDIRPDENEGLRDYEQNLLDLIKTITSGTNVQLTRNRLQLNPGTIVGGQVSHNCHVDRSISYYLEVLLCLAPFCKKAFEATLTGVTNDQIDPNVDSIKASSLPLLKRFIGDTEGVKLDIKVTARGFKPGGEPGKIKRVRGVAVASRVSPQMGNRLIDTSKGLLLRFLPDVYIYSDHQKGKSSGLSPGFSLSLVAETTEGCMYTASAVSNSKGSSGGPTVPEDLGKDATHQLFEEIERGGCVDSINQSLAMTMMAFNQKDVSIVRFGQLTTYTILYLRHLKEFCGLTFKLETCENNEVLATCAGIGYKNLSKPTY